MDKNRFKQLLESTMGNVKPLIMEQEKTLKVRITKSTTNSWYKNFIGKVFTVYQPLYDDDFYEVIFSDEEKKSIPNADKLHAIKKEDCEVVK